MSAPVSHAAHDALLNGSRDRFVTLATKLEKLLRAEATLPLKELLVVRDPSQCAIPIGARYELRGCLVLGSSSCNVVVNDDDCSRRHACILELAGRGGPAVLYDESTNGIFLNDQPLTGTRLLTDGDRIRIGGREFRFLERLG